MKHLRAINRKANRIDDIVMSKRQDVVALQDPATAKRLIFRPDARSRSFRDGKWILPAARPVSASLWNVTFTIVTSRVSGRRRFPITSMPIRTGRRSVPWPLKTGAIWTLFFRREASYEGTA